MRCPCPSLRATLRIYPTSHENPERHYAVGIVYRYHKPCLRGTKGKCIVRNLPFERETIHCRDTCHRAVFERRIGMYETDLKRLPYHVRFFGTLILLEVLQLELLGTDRKVRTIQIVENNFEYLYINADRSKVR